MIAISTPIRHSPHLPKSLLQPSNAVPKATHRKREREANHAVEIGLALSLTRYRMHMEGQRRIYMPDRVAHSASQKRSVPSPSSLTHSLAHSLQLTHSINLAFATITHLYKQQQCLRLQPLETPSARKSHSPIHSIHPPGILGGDFPSQPPPPPPPPPPSPPLPTASSRPPPFRAKCLGVRPL